MEEEKVAEVASKTIMLAIIAQAKLAQDERVGVSAVAHATAVRLLAEALVSIRGF